MSIDKRVLFDLLAPRIADDDTLWLTRQLVFHDCTQDYFLKGDPSLRARLPAHTTLFGSGPGKDLPIGNLNSQFFANVYLNALDQFVKHQLKCRHYLRYCDDFVLLAESREQLLAWREQIRIFLRERLRLELNDARERLRPVSDGVDFLGYVVRGDYRLVRRRVVGNCYQRLQGFERRLVREGVAATRYSFDAETVDRLQASAASYFGHFGKASARRLGMAIWRRFSFLGEYLALDPSSCCVEPKFAKRHTCNRVAQQYRYFCEHFLQDRVLMQVGAFFEFYSLRPANSPGLGMGLKPMGRTRRGVRQGFPLAQLGARLAGLIAAGVPVTLVRETALRHGRLKQRVPAWRWAPQPVTPS